MQRKKHTKHIKHTTKLTFCMCVCIVGGGVCIDLKPTNIFLTATDEIRIGDFGVLFYFFSFVCFDFAFDFCFYFLKFFWVSLQ